MATWLELGFRHQHRLARSKDYSRIYRNGAIRFGLDDSKCQKCGSTKNLEWHDLEYSSDNYKGKSLPKNLKLPRIRMCKKCHSKIPFKIMCIKCGKRKLKTEFIYGQICKDCASDSILTFVSN